MKKLTIKLNDGTKLVYRQNYIWFDDIKRQINSQNDFLEMDETLIRKTTIDKIDLVDEEADDNRPNNE